VIQIVHCFEVEPKNRTRLVWHVKAGGLTGASGKSRALLVGCGETNNPNVHLGHLGRKMRVAGEGSRAIARSRPCGSQWAATFADEVGQARFGGWRDHERGFRDGYWSEFRH
jgi:hypothetical protein